MEKKRKKQEKKEGKTKEEGQEKEGGKSQTNGSLAVLTKAPFLHTPFLPAAFWQ